MKTEESKLDAQQEQLDIPVVMHSSTPNYLHFRVNGAGEIQITEDCQYQCGGEEGFSFGVEWGKYGFAGGVLVAVIFCGCGNENQNEKEVQINIKASWGIDAYVRLIEVDSCEYIVSTRNDAISTIHKQNCKFCAERSKK